MHKLYYIIEYATKKRSKVHWLSDSDLAGKIDGVTQEYLPLTLLTSSQELKIPDQFDRLS